MTPPTVTTLPAVNPPLAQPHTAKLEGPQSVQAGTANMWAVLLTNTGNTAISLQHGACDVRFEVLNAAGQVVRTTPKDAICTLQIVGTNVAPGETGELQKIRWEGKNDQNQNVPAGTYTIRSVFNGDGVLIRPADFTVTVR
ncbi:FlgD immunoglobulin-like domain containing protein [Deinococcus saxicola]